MVKTHPYLRFALKSLNQIRDSSDVILQIEKTGSEFSNTKEEIYLCEVVSSNMYNKAGTLECLTNEIIKVNSENRQLRNKIKRLEKEMD